MVREAVLEFLEQEVPHAVAVAIDEYKERDNDKVFIAATLYVERDGQKGIIIGRQGSMLASIRKKSTRDIAEMLDRKVSLRLWVKVKKKWTRNEQILRELGM